MKTINCRQTLNIFSLWRFIILLCDTFPQRRRSGEGLNICGKFQRTCLNIAFNEKDSGTTPAQNITSSVARKFSVFVGARKYRDNRVRNVRFTVVCWGKDSHRCTQFVSNGPCCGKLKLQLCKSCHSEVSPFYFWPNLLMKWGLSNYCTCVSISPCNNDLACWLALIKSAKR